MWAKLCDRDWNERERENKKRRVSEEVKKESR